MIFKQKRFGTSSAVNKWWLIISTTIFSIIAMILLVLLSFGIRQQKQLQIQYTVEYAQKIMEELSKEDTQLTVHSIVDRFAKSQTYKINRNGVFYNNLSIEGLKESEINLQIFNTSKEKVFKTKNWHIYSDFPIEFKVEEIVSATGTQEIQAGGAIFSKDSRLLIGYLQLNNRMTGVVKTERNFWILYGLSLLISLFVSLIAGYVLSTRMIGPIRRIMKIISSINDENIETTRLTIPSNDKELLQVTYHMNELLDRITFYIEQQKHFVEDVSHELRTPVAIVEGHLKLLNRWGKDDPEVLEESLSASLSEIQRMKTLVQEMLDLSRMADIQKQYADSETDVYTTVEHVVSNFRILHESFKFIFDPDLENEIAIPMYHNHFEQVLIILLDNAVKYSLNRKEIIISLSQGVHMVEIAIQDFGMGMTESDQKKVFSRFYRVDKARSREKGGNGLGLSIAKQIVEAYQGEISVSSVLDKGSVFRIKLPIKFLKESFFSDKY